MHGSGAGLIVVRFSLPWRSWKVLPSSSSGSLRKIRWKTTLQREKWKEEAVFIVCQKVIKLERPVMGTYSSSEDLFVKTRKPYTITKQRERWTEDEHNRFLDALKLYGRAWQRIEEHIGTKTAVQIRSHAQKFFSKLEKEAHARGVPLCQTLDIEIPPPRPKRKPSNPYPRKSSGNPPTNLSVGLKDGKAISSASSLQQGEQILCFKNDLHPEKHAGNENSAGADEPPEDENCSEVLTYFKEPPCTSISSASKSPAPKSLVLENSCTVKESMPLLESLSDQGAKDESDLSMESKENQKSDKTEAHFADLDLSPSKSPDLENCFCESHESSMDEERTDELKQPERLSPLPTDEMQFNHYNPRHVPGHIIGGDSKTCIPNQSPNTHPPSIIYQVGGSHGNPNFFTNQTTEQHCNSSMSFDHQSSPNLVPHFAPYLQNQDTYSSLLNISSTFPNLIISALLQNPATHMAASLAASFWPCTNVESVESQAGTIGGFPFRQMSPSTNLAALAAATVAAATAWWTTHGLLPLCPPLHPGFTCPPAPMAVTLEDTSQVPIAKKGKDSRPQDPPRDDQKLDSEFSESLKPQNSASKLPTLPLSDSVESRGRRSNSNEQSATGQVEEPAPIAGLGDSNKVKARKKVNRSSCGSNTPSSSEVETDALEKYEKGGAEAKEPEASHPLVDPNNRRNRTLSYSYESWKEVSDEGRLAFQALFSREVLPQSFSPPHDLRNKEQNKNGEEGKQKSNKIDDNALQLDLNGKNWDVSPNHTASDKSDLSSSKSSETGLLFIGLGQGKLRNRRTGFKPYKRCSMEAKESRISTGSSKVEENVPKRIRLDGGALT